MSRFRAPIVLLTAVIIAAPAYTAGLEAIDLEKLPGFLAAETRVENFRNVDTLFPSRVVKAADEPFSFRRDEQDLSDTSYTFNGETSTVGEFLDKTVTTGFLVIKADAIVTENYFLGHSEDQRHLSMSVAKSFLSALVGIAIGEGKIAGIMDPATKYLPELADSGYQGVPIKHLLQMSSGIDFSEVYDDDGSDINTMFLELAAGTSLGDYIAGLGSTGPSGKTFQYASVDTQVLAMILEKVYGQALNEILHEKIWSKIGMEHDAYYSTDNHGNALAFGFLNVSLRDYAKFGRLYQYKGDWERDQVVPKKWVEDSVKPDADYLKLKDHYAPGWDIGYQYQWWVPAGMQAEFTGIGVWGQYLYVNPAERVIIVKNSVDPDFNTRDMETIAVFRAVCAKLRGGAPIPMIMEHGQH